MIAIILSAGLGTRLKPHTLTLPKPLFPLGGTVLLDRIVLQLFEAGVTDIIINTHHLHQKLEAHVREQHYPVKILTRFEAQILGTGGALKNITDFWREGPLLVVNGDIVTDIDFKQVYQFHLGHRFPVTMVMHDYPAFNGVSVDENGFITHFGDTDRPLQSISEKKLAYTGIQVVDHKISEMIPAGEFCSIIEIYKNFLARKGKIAAYIAQDHRWHDMGSPVGYRNAVLEQLTPVAFAASDATQPDTAFEEIHLAGDGSDRKWSRLHGSSGTLVLADHGITADEKIGEAESFIRIGRHLASKNIAVPTIYAADSFSGLVLMEDLGDVSLHSLVTQTANHTEIRNLYCKVIDQLLRFSMEGIKDFDPKWSFQTQRYDRDLIIEKECRYFLNAFINDYLGMETSYEVLQAEFEELAELTIKNAVWGLMHRDCQSRNIMWRNEQCFFIDFQGARVGPIQYDLASLLIDPYVELEQNLQNELLIYFNDRLTALSPQWDGQWQKGFLYCQLTRNLQILGAFAYLSKVKGKTFFTQFIPKAVKSLKKLLQTSTTFTRLYQLVNQISANI